MVISKAYEHEPKRYRDTIVFPPCLAWLAEHCYCEEKKFIFKIMERLPPLIEIADRKKVL